MTQEKQGLLRFLTIEQLASALCTVVLITLAWASLAGDVENNREATEENAEAIKAVAKDIAVLKTDTALTRQAMDNVEKDVDEIKSMLKELSKKQ